MGFENSGFTHDSKHPAFYPEDFNEDAFWKQITGESRYKPKSAKASRIHNPVFRYIHKTMALTIFGRHETGTINSAELFMLWSMAYSRPVNTCFYMIRHLAHLADTGTSPITVGGMVTFIAEKLGFDAQIDQLVGLAPPRIDYAYCGTFFLIEPIVRGSHSQSYLLISRQRSITLPNPEMTEITNPGNWLYLNPAGGNLFGNIEQEQVQVEEEMAEQDAPHAPHQGFNMEEWCTRIEGQMNRQEAELLAMREEQRVRGERTDHMLQTLMNHFSINYDPPPGQQ